MKRDSSYYEGLLKPCPFCGSTNLLVEVDAEFIECIGCGIRFWFMQGRDDDMTPHQERMVMVWGWNQRPGEKPEREYPGYDYEELE